MDTNHNRSCVDVLLCWTLQYVNHVAGSPHLPGALASETFSLVWLAGVRLPGSPRRSYNTGGHTCRNMTALKMPFFAC